MNKSLIATIIASAMLTACSNSQAPIDPSIKQVTVQAQVQTQAVLSDDDAADDSVVWFNQTDAANSLVIGTNKRWGLEVYNLDGQRVQQLPVGRVNNVDLRNDVTGQYDSIAAASNRTNKSISLFSINAEGTLVQTGDVATGLNDPYGICMGQVQGVNYVYVNDKDGRYQQWRVDTLSTATKVREWALPAQPEGCAVDDVTGVLYFGIEEMGLYKMSAAADAPTDWQLIDATGAGRLVADIEGIDIYRTDEYQLLLTSSQGNNSYVIYQLDANTTPVGIVRVGDGASIDGTAETDGIAVSAHLLPGFEKGIWVIQDGVNTAPAANQNFKYVSMADVLMQLGLD